MTLYAIDAIDEALAATKEFLWPVALRRWAKLAVILLFVGGVGGTNPLQLSSGSPPNGSDFSVSELPELPADGPTLDPQLMGLFVLAGLGLLGLILLFMLLGAIMEFVFVESLRQDAVSIRAYWRRYWPRGVRLFFFRVIVGLLTLGSLGALIGLFVYPMLTGRTMLSLAFLVILVPVGLVIVIGSGLVTGFTTMFIVPIMLLEERGVLAAWQRFWPTMTAQWKQYAAYAVLGFVLQLAGGIIAGIGTVIAAVLVGIPFGLVGLFGWGLLTVNPVLGGVVIAIAAGLFLLAVLCLVLLIRVPIQTYLRYYGLLVLGATNDTFDVLGRPRSSESEANLP